MKDNNISFANYGHDLVRAFPSYSNRESAFRQLSHDLFLKDTYRFREYICLKCEYVFVTYRSSNYKIMWDYYNVFKKSLTCDEILIKKLLE